MSAVVIAFEIPPRTLFLKRKELRIDPANDLSINPPAPGGFSLLSLSMDTQKLQKQPAKAITSQLPAYV